jgi:perosamine synthetase
MPRHLAPTAVPIAASDLRRGLSPPASSCAQFETALTRYLAVATCKLAASGRTALYLLLRGLRQTASDPERCEVVMPAYTCPSLARVALDLDLRPRFIDISPHTLTFQDEHSTACTGQRTLAVILVHPFGIPQPTEHTQRLAHAAGAVVIEDAAQALGARLGPGGVPVGTQADFGLFSLGPGKPLSTGGGGFVCARDERRARVLDEAWRELPQPSALMSRWALIRLALFSLAFHPTGWWLATRAGLHRVGEHEASWGYTVRGLSNAQAAVGMGLLEQLEAINRKRQENAQRLIDGLQEIEHIHIPPAAETTDPIYLRLPILIDDAERRERLFRRLWQAGIGAGRMYRHALPYYFPQAANGGTFPGADYVARHLLTLPTHHYLTYTDVQHIVEICQFDNWPSLR